MDGINFPYITTTVLKFKSQKIGHGQIEGFIPDAEFSNTHENTNTGRELCKLLYNGAPH